MSQEIFVLIHPKKLDSVEKDAAVVDMNIRLFKMMTENPLFKDFPNFLNYQS